MNADAIARDRLPGDELARAYEATQIAERARRALIKRARRSITDARLDVRTDTVVSHTSG